MKLIKLVNKEQDIFAIVDEEDYGRVQQYKWRLHRGYVHASMNGTTVRLHRYILNLNPRQFIVDHLNHNPLDNRRSNLRICTSSQNSMNRQRSIANKSGYKGVCWRGNTSDKHWCATIYKDYKQFHLGYYPTPKEAAKVYDEKALELFGEFALVNFPGGY